jgi:hypothetical protein
VVSWTLSSLGFIEGTNSLSRTFSVKAGQTITNSDYLVSADDNFSAAGLITVVTLIEAETVEPPLRVYLPVILKIPQ